MTIELNKQTKNQHKNIPDDLYIIYYKYSDVPEYIKFKQWFIK